MTGGDEGGGLDEDEEEDENDNGNNNKYVFSQSELTKKNCLLRKTLSFGVEENNILVT